MSSKQSVSGLRALAAISEDTDIILNKLQTGRLEDSDYKKLNEAAENLSRHKIFFDDANAVNLRSLKAKARRLKKKHDIGLIVIDYLQLMQGESKNNREQEIATISRELKNLAQELEIPIIALSQLSRAVENRPDKLPQLSDLRESGGIEQDADSVIFLMRPETYNIPEIEISGNTIPSNGLCVVKIAKNRHGSLKNIPFRFIGELMAFEEYENPF